MPKHKVQLFVTCLIDTLKPEIGESVVNVLNHLGVDITFPQEQTCCGQPAFNAGLRFQAKKMAKRTIEIFEKSQDPIVLPSGSCTSMIRQGYLDLFADDHVWLKRASDLAARTFEFTEYIVDVLGIENIGAYFPHKITYHPSCHLLRNLGIDKQPRTLLANVQGAEFIELPHATECCGFGGVFSASQPEISSAMLERKLNNIMSIPATVVVTCDTGCLLNIEGGVHRKKLPRRIMHIAEVLDNFE